MTLDTAAPGLPSALPPLGGSQRSLDDLGYRATVLEVLGMLASGQIASFARLAEDASFAPDLEGRITLSRMAAGELANLDLLDRQIRELGGSTIEQMDVYREVLTDFDLRTVPRDWWERLIKTYIGFSMIVDLQREFVARLDARTREQIEDVVADNGHGDYVVGVLTPVIAAEPQLGARLALWGRRVVGEGLGVAAQVLHRFPVLAELIGDGEDAANAVPQLLNRLSGKHSRRMARLQLTA